MIAYLIGTIKIGTIKIDTIKIGAIKIGAIKNREGQSITILNNNIGYLVHVPSQEVFNENEEAQLHIHFHWNQENGPQLYGFREALDKQVFGLVISCSGLGPKIGLAVISCLGSQAFLEAIKAADIKRLSSISGIGAKKAEFIVMQLKDKAAQLSPSLAKNSDLVTIKHIQQLTQVLSSLNYSRSEVYNAVEYIKAEYAHQEIEFDFMLRKGLSFLAKKI